MMRACNVYVAGCDSVVLAFMIILLSIALAPSRPFIYGWAIPMYYAFFSGQWEEAHTGTMRTGIGTSWKTLLRLLSNEYCVLTSLLVRWPLFSGYIGVTEGTFFCILVLLVRGVFGWELYHLCLREVFVDDTFNLPSALSFVLDTTVGELTSILVAIVNTVIVLSFTKDVIIGKGKVRSTVYLYYHTLICSMFQVDT